MQGKERTAYFFLVSCILEMFILLVKKRGLDEQLGSFKVKFNMTYKVLCHYGIISLSPLHKPKILSSTIIHIKLSKFYLDWEMMKYS